MITLPNHLGEEMMNSKQKRKPENLAIYPVAYVAGLRKSRPPPYEIFHVAWRGRACQFLLIVNGVTRVNVKVQSAM
ncbi:hypothetical protein DWB67_16955 [Paracoccus sp. JM45]|nr:hypothetical protein DWB67_16955 [Paracoccus sp. JM45]